MSLNLWCRNAVDRYLELFPSESGRLTSLRELIGLNLAMDDRTTLPGHVTGSGIIVDLERKRVLLIHHKALNRWLQPGGHVDAGEMPPAAARREIREEVGIVHAKLISPSSHQELPIDIDSHPIPANIHRAEPAHMHHDFRFLFAVDSTLALSLAVEEVVSSEWMAFTDQRMPFSVKGAIDKAMALNHD